MVFVLYYIPINTANYFQPEGQDNGSQCSQCKEFVINIGSSQYPQVTPGYSKAAILQQEFLKLDCVYLPKAQAICIPLLMGILMHTDIHLFWRQFHSNKYKQQYQDFGFVLLWKPRFCWDCFTMFVNLSIN